MAAAGIDWRTEGVSVRHGALTVPELGIQIRPGESELLLGAYSRARHLRERGAQFGTAADGSLKCQIAGITVEVHTSEELQILDEVFVDGVYNVDMDGALLIIDVGMNAGFASLRFAHEHPEAVVLGFEPVGPTLRRAWRNLELNKETALRIETRQVGWAGADGQAEIEYAPAWAGSVGLFGVPKGLCEVRAIGREQIELIDASKALRTAIRQHPRRRVVLKLDCEGAEHVIVERLASAGDLASVAVALVECHRRDPSHDVAKVRSTFVKAGFACVHRDADSPDISMLYAFRRGEP